VPLWILVLSAQVLDIIFFLFCVFGWEGYSVDHSKRGPLSLDLHSHEYTHSLIGSLTISLLVYTGIRLWKRSFALPIAVVVFSHFLLDVVVHNEDLLIWGDLKIGLGLWNYTTTAYLFELGLAAGTWFWMVGIRPTMREFYLIGILFSSQTIYVYLLPLPSTPLYFLLLAWTVMGLQTRAAAYAESSRLASTSAKPV
jgi:membrane-bound metal-dependent hydrolase YbcI (DUF457 family)